MLFIFGANGGIGRGLLESYTRTLGYGYGGVTGVYRDMCDIEDENSVRAFWENLDGIDSVGRGPVYFINATGKNVNGMLHKYTFDDMALTMNVNVVGSAVLLKHFRRVIKTRPGSAAVLLTSVVGRLGVPGCALYGAAKSAIVGLTRSVAKEFAPIGGRVNCVEMGYYDVGMMESIPSAQREAIIDQIPLKRLGRVDDLRKVCDFALSCEYLTGASITVSGGL